MALLKITDASGRQWEYSFQAKGNCTIGRAPDNSIVLDDPRASRYHAHVTSAENGSFLHTRILARTPRRHGGAEVDGRKTG